MAEMNSNTSLLSMSNIYKSFGEVEVLADVNFEVGRNEIIGLSGNTGISRGPHLHFALIVRGEPTDPLLYMRGGPQNARRVSMRSLQRSGQGSTSR